MNANNLYFLEKTALIGGATRFALRNPFTLLGGFYGAREGSRSFDEISHTVPRKYKNVYKPKWERNIFQRLFGKENITDDLPIPTNVKKWQMQQVQ